MDLRVRRSAAEGVHGETTGLSSEAWCEGTPLALLCTPMVTHVADNRGADDVIYFGEAVRLRPGGGVEYLVDPRYEHHDALGRLVDAVEAALLTLAGPDDSPFAPR